MAPTYRLTECKVTALTTTAQRILAKLLHLCKGEHNQCVWTLRRKKSCLEELGVFTMEEHRCDSMPALHELRRIHSRATTLSQLFSRARRYRAKTNGRSDVWGK